MKGSFIVFKMLRCLRSSNSRKLFLGMRNLCTARCEISYGTSKVTLVGSCTRVGQMTALLLKQSPLMDILALYDDCEQNAGIAMDLSHIDTNCEIVPYTGYQKLRLALELASVVVLCTGIEKTPGVSDDIQFKMNADMVTLITENIARRNPEAILAIATQPVNCMVPMVCDILNGLAPETYDPKKVVGVTAVDGMRANTFLGACMDINPSEVTVPVIGGHSKNTIVPLLSHGNPSLSFANNSIIYKDIVKRVRCAEEAVHAARKGQGTDFMARAFGIARFTTSLVRGLQGDPSAVECAFIKTDKVEGIDYCALPVELGQHGIKSAYSIPFVNDFEKQLLEDAIKDLQLQIHKGQEYAKLVLRNRTSK